MTTIDRTDRARLHTDVQLAARVLAPNWPLGRFIAVNPLGGFEDRPFAEAVAEASGWFGSSGVPDERVMRTAYADGRITHDELAGALRAHLPQIAGAPPLTIGGRPISREQVLIEDMLWGEPAAQPDRRHRTLAESISPASAALIDSQSGKWLAAFLDRGQARWQMPGRERGFHAAWRALAIHDPALNRSARRALSEVAERSDDALAWGLERLRIGHRRRRDYLRRHLTALPGWAAHVRWHSDHRTGLDLLDYLAMRVAYEAVLIGDLATDEDRQELWSSNDSSGPGSPTPADRAGRVLESFAGLQATADDHSSVAELLAQLPVSERPLIWLTAYEQHYRDRLISSLAEHRAPESDSTRPPAQLVCCIDARSEGLRRHLEQLGPYETLGFAGFFAVAIRFRSLASPTGRDLCPVLLEPKNEITEVASSDHQAEQFLRGRHNRASAAEAFHSAKDDAAAPFATAEVSGWISGPIAAVRTAAPRRFAGLKSALGRRLTPDVETTVTAAEGFALDERRLLAQVALTMMGLTSGFGRLVVLCGHGSTTENNPYAAALDCGACGGHRGGPNARTMAAILNDDEVRESLAGQGIEIPQDTWFCAAEHDTATDTVTVLDHHLIPGSHALDLLSLERDLAQAGEGLSAERSLSLPGRPPNGGGALHTAERSGDWAQVFPEWGLAGNAAFIVGPREMTRGLDLERRAFLHSYEADVDASGEALETILTAPLVVAQWINCQYYFSTVDPVVHGAGTKTIHNVVSGIGVLAGHNGDLQLGLPWQSVADGERLVHEPMRLQAIVQAPLDRISKIIDRNEILQRLFGGQWVALVARESQDDPWMQYSEGRFIPWTPIGNEA